MAKQTATVWVAATRYKWQQKHEVNFDLYTHEPGDHFEDDEHQLVGRQEITFEVPDSYNFDAKIIDILQAEKIRVMAEFQVRITQIERQIQEHLALPMAETMPEGGTHGF